MKTSLKTAVVTAVFVALAGPAVAEGAWSSYITNAHTGFRSRNWTDNATDGANTGISFSRCTYYTPGTSTSSIGVEVSKDISLAPDKHYGTQLFWCAPTSTNVYHSWGNPGAGNFFFTINSIAGGGTGGTGYYEASVGSLTTSY